MKIYDVMHAIQYSAVQVQNYDAMDYVQYFSVQVKHYFAIAAHKSGSALYIRTTSCKTATWNVADSTRDVVLNSISLGE
jgi:hypothetical protein